MYMSLSGSRLFKSASISITCLIAFSAAIAATAFSFSWFSNNNYQKKGIAGSTAGAYYASGKGTEEQPFILNKPRHVYNLAWLQYMDTYNDDKAKSSGTSETKTIETTYFKLGADIDMSGWVTPPIGTKETPFIGNFNGGGYVISNLTITNNKANLTRIPQAVTEKKGFTSPEIIGFFGVVGSFDEAYESKYTYDSTVNKIYDLYLDKVTIQNSSTNVLSGLLAGYVNGYMARCGVYRGKFDFSSGTSKIDSFDRISDYSLIGAYNSDKYTWEDVPGGGGQEDDFGGSVDMLSINRRLDYMVSAIQNGLVTKGSNSYGDNAYWTNSDIYDVSVSTNKQSSETYWNEGTISSLFCYYLWRGTYLPLNIDEVASGLKDKDGNLLTTESSVNGWHLTDLYKEGREETITSTNTGYIVGGNPNVRTNVMPIAGYQRSSSSTPYAGIYKSMGLSSIDTSGKTFNQFESTTPIQLLTINGNTLYRIDDEKNKNYSYPGLASITSRTYSSSNFSKYEQVIGNFRKSMSDAKTIHGFHFLQSIDMSSLTTSTHAAKICGNDYENYQFINSSLNFTLKKDGYISTLMGGYYRQGYDCTCFDIYSVSRDDAGAIQSIKKITQIYKKSGKTIHKYLDSSGKTSYSDGSSSSSGMTLVADFDYLSSSSNLCIKEGAAYYFEFPAIEGDYVIGASKQNNYNAYLMYLDIGANASSEDPGTEKTKALSKIDFVYSEDGKIVKITDTNFDTIKSNVIFQIEGSTTSALQIYFQRLSLESGVYYYVTVAKQLTITPIEADNGKEGEEAKW